MVQIEPCEFLIAPHSLQALPLQLPLFNPFLLPQENLPAGLLGILKGVIAGIPKSTRNIPGPEKVHVIF